MGKKSKKKNKAEKRRKAQEFHNRKAFEKIGADVSKISSLDKKTLLDYKVALNPKIKDMAENPEHFILIFSDYNHNECQITNLRRDQAKSVIEKFSQITENSPNSLLESNLIRDDVENLGEYQKLYSNLSSPDAKLKEIEIAGDGRIFCYIVGRYFCIVAIQAIHKNTDR